MKKVYKGICRNHSGGKALVAKVMRVAYYWLNALKDDKEFVKK